MAPSQTLQLVRHIEGLALRAWPAAEQQSLDGWRLRFNAGVTRRANSVSWPPSPHSDAALPYSNRCHAPIRGYVLVVRI